MRNLTLVIKLLKVSLLEILFVFIILAEKANVKPCLDMFYSIFVFKDLVARFDERFSGSEENLRLNLSYFC